MHLHTLGRLMVSGAAITQPKPLLLLAYLAMEGRQERAFLAQLFFPDTRVRARSNLSVLLTRLRKGAPGSVEADEHSVTTALPVDAGELLERLEQAQHEEALALYRGPFLGPAELPPVGVELENWIYGMREFLASRVQLARLALAETAAAAGDYRQAAAGAEDAFRLAHAVPETGTLRRLHTLLLAGNSAQEAAAANEAELVAYALARTPEEARERLQERLMVQDQLAPNNLPPAGTSFVGRDVELAEIAELLGEHRLVSLVGGGGVGKSRLALRAARQQLRQHLSPDGVFLVPLEAVLEVAALPISLASALAFDLQGPGDPVAQLIDRLHDKQLLLILDNFEHLLDGAELVARLLQACPRVRVLVTSRERLHLQEEWLFEVRGLAFPTDAATTFEEAQRFDAVQLFLARARQAHPEFTPTPADGLAIVALCWQVAGLPLALELAASWTRALPVAELHRELTRSLDLLASPTRDLDARHRTIRASFEHSWELLDAREQRFFRRLAVFQGGFRRALAATVSGATLPLLAGLVDKSLLRLTPGGRYDRHPLLYQYGLEKLAADPNELRRMRRRHAEALLPFVASLEEDLVTDKPVETVVAIAEELPNLRAAWAWAVEHARSDLLQQAAWMMAGFLLHTAQIPEGLALTARALERLRPLQAEHPTAVGTLLCCWGWLAAFGGTTATDFEASVAAADEGLALLQPPSYETMGAIGFGYEAKNWSLSHLQRFDEAQAATERLLDVAQRVGHRMWIALGYKNQGLVPFLRGDFATARTLLEQALEIERREGFAFNQLAGMDFLGRAYVQLGLLDEAAALYQEGLELARARSHQRMVVLFTLGLGRVALEQQAYAEAERWYQKAWQEAQQRDARPFEADVLQGLAACARALGRPAEAKRHAKRLLELGVEEGG